MEETNEQSNSNLEHSHSFLELTEKSLEMEQFRQAREMSAKATKFQEEHQKDWIHTVPRTRSLLTYTYLSHHEKKSAKEVYLVPEFTMSDIGTFESTRHSSLDTTNNPEFPDSKEGINMLQSDEFESSFSGLLHVPSFSFTRPDSVKSQINLSQYLLHTHFEVGEVTYFFGGLQSEPSRALKMLGIPRSTDPSRISVHFPCDMPPFVNKDMLMSPYILPNQSFFVFNPTRSTVHDYSSPSFEEFEPGHFCDMKGTQISEYQVFFCGGFKVNIDKVNFDKESGRWIVEKSISTNENGFILDVRKLSFTKISLISRLELEYCGRIGAALCSNFADVPGRPKDDIFECQTHSDYVGDFSFGSNSHRNYARYIPSLTSTLSPVSPESPFPPFPSTSPDPHLFPAQSSSVSLSSKSSKMSAKTLDTKSIDDMGLPNRTKDTGITTSAASILKHGDKSLNESALSAESTETRDTKVKAHSVTHGDGRPSFTLDPKYAPQVELAAPSSHKVPSMIAKSSRFFHRSLHKQTAGVGLSPVDSSYSHHVKQHRSKSLLNNQAEIRATMQSPSLRSSNTVVESNQYEGAHSISATKSRDSAVVEQNAFSTTRKYQPSQTLGEDHAETQDQSEKHNVTIYDAETRKSDQKSGISSICVYLFGGFFLISHSDGHQSFKATNDLLKLELIISDKGTSDIHPEALIDTIHPQTDQVPGPRGYFAHVLTSGNFTDETCHVFGPECRSQTDSERQRAPLNISDVLSNSDKSTQTEMLSQSNMNRDNMNLIIHGGVDENYNVYGDCFYFSFDKECWVSLDTYAFDYYEIPKKPYEDEDSSKLNLETQLENAKLVDAELRSCHHKAMVYWEGNKEYVAFVGGFTNDFLRHFDRVPYESEKFDVSRLGRLLVTSVNSNLLRIPVLNLRSQVWKFKRYFYDLTELARPGFIELLKNKCMQNSRLALSGGGILLVGKQLTFCHGLVQFVPEKFEDYESMQQVLSNSSILLGGHFHLTFPGM